MVEYMIRGMAKFCSECGEPTTELMRRCPRCGATLMACAKDCNAMVRIAIICMSVFIMLSTMFSWYSMHLSIDGGVMDAVVGVLMRIVPGFSGIGTTYGLAIFGLAVAMIIFAVCRNRWLTAVAAVGCVVVGMLALLSPPDIADLWQSGGTEGGRHLNELFEGPMASLSPMNTPEMSTYKRLIGLLPDYITVEVGHGVKVMLILVYATAALSIYDLVSSMRRDRCNK